MTGEDEGGVDLLKSGLFMAGTIGLCILSLVLILLVLEVPVALRLGVEPNHFGIIIVVNLAIGQITPPVGVNLFVACGISRTPLGEVSRGVWPLVIAEAVALLLITYFPALSLVLPKIVAQ